MLIQSTPLLEDYDRSKSMARSSFEDRLHLWHTKRTGHCTCSTCRPSSRLRSQQTRGVSAVRGDGHTCVACNVPFYMITFDANLKPSTVERDVQHVPDFTSQCITTFGSKEEQDDRELDDEGRRSDGCSDPVTTIRNNSQV